MMSVNSVENVIRLGGEKHLETVTGGMGSSLSDLSLILVLSVYTDFKGIRSVLPTYL